MLKLQRALGHVVTLTPLLDTGDVVVDLQAALPREEVAAHQQVVKGRDADQAQQFRHRLGDDAILEVIRLHGAEHVVEEAEEVGVDVVVAETAVVVEGAKREEPGLAAAVVAAEAEPVVAEAAAGVASPAMELEQQLAVVSVGELVAVA